MSLQIKNRPARSAEASPVRIVYRRAGIVASLLAGIVAVGANWQLDRARNRYRSGKAPHVPNWLREDIGLPPLPPRLPDWWEQRW